MKVYITSRFKGLENKSEVEALCRAVSNAGMIDFSFVRDIEGFTKKFEDPKELWRRAKQELEKCDALLIDVSDAPSGGRIIEEGMAFALDMPIFVVSKSGHVHKSFHDGLADLFIPYEVYSDIVEPLTRYRLEHTA